MTSGVNSLISDVLKVEMAVYYTEETQNIIRDGLPWILFRQVWGGRGFIVQKQDLLAHYSFYPSLFFAPQNFFYGSSRRKPFHILIFVGKHLTPSITGQKRQCVWFHFQPIVDRSSLWSAEQGKYNSPYPRTCLGGLVSRERIDSLSRVSLLILHA